jgi:hypothetical protein
MTSTPRTYRVTFLGEIGPATRAAFSEMEARVEHGRTVLSAELPDQAALFSVLNRIHSLGLDLVHLECHDRLRSSALHEP